MYYKAWYLLYDSKLQNFNLVVFLLAKNSDVRKFFF